MNHTIPIDQQKAELRRYARKYLQNQLPQTAVSWGHHMAQTLLSHPLWTGAHTVFCFVSTPLEPSTTPLLQAALAASKTLCVPRTSCIAGEMDAVAIRSLSPLSPSRFGLLEPPPQLPSQPPHLLDLVIAPCLMANSNGARLGQGGGYYDRFLTHCTCPIVVLCPSELTHLSIPLSPHDRAANFVLTENGFLK